MKFVWYSIDNEGDTGKQKKSRSFKGSESCKRKRSDQTESQVWKDQKTKRKTDKELNGKPKSPKAQKK